MNSYVYTFSMQSIDRIYSDVTRCKLQPTGDDSVAEICSRKQHNHLSDEKCNHGLGSGIMGQAVIPDERGRAESRSLLWMDANRWMDGSYTFTVPSSTSTARAINHCICDWVVYQESDGGNEQVVTCKSKLGRREFSKSKNNSTIIDTKRWGVVRVPLDSGLQQGELLLNTLHHLGVELLFGFLGSGRCQHDIVNSWVAVAHTEFEWSRHTSPDHTWCRPWFRSSPSSTCGKCSGLCDGASCRRVPAVRTGARRRPGIRWDIS